MKSYRHFGAYVEVFSSTLGRRVLIVGRNPLDTVVDLSCAGCHQAVEAEAPDAAGVW